MPERGRDVHRPRPRTHRGHGSRRESPTKDAPQCHGQGCEHHVGFCLGVLQAPRKSDVRRPEWTTSESADRARSGACLVPAKQASDAAGPSHLVLVLSECLRKPWETRVSSRGKQRRRFGPERTRSRLAREHKADSAGQPIAVIVSWRVPLGVVTDTTSPTRAPMSARATGESTDSLPLAASALMVATSV